MMGNSNKHFEFAGFAMLMLLPLAGLWVTGKFNPSYLEFPPLTRYVKHPPFSWWVFIGLAVVILAVTAPFIIRALRSKPRESRGSAKDAHPASNARGRGLALLICGISLCGASWVLAWSRFAWFADFQVYTFTPLWLGYILVVNGIARIRSGSCMILDRPKYCASLFILSAFFWWFFEYLNRFVQNWYYVGIGELSPVEYFIYATLPFSTVLPAVLGTYELLRTFPRLYAGLDTFIRIKAPKPRLSAGCALVFFAAGLALIGIYPDYLFPLLWVSPLGILVSIQALSGKKTIFADIANGDWGKIALLALSALVCGFFWEMWNYHSLAKWVYEVPFVTRFKIFEMPLLGYSGYLPFGLECAVVCELLGGGADEI